MKFVFYEVRSGLLCVNKINFEASGTYKVQHKTCFITRTPASAVTYIMHLI